MWENLNKKNKILQKNIKKKWNSPRIHKGFLKCHLYTSYITIESTILFIVILYANKYNNKYLYNTWNRFWDILVQCNFVQMFFYEILSSKVAFIFDHFNSKCHSLNFFFFLFLDAKPNNKLSPCMSLFKFYK